VDVQDFGDTFLNPVILYQQMAPQLSFRAYLKYKTLQFQKVRIGDEVAIPLLLADEKEALVESLVQKANNIASLKADLIGDLSGLVSGLNNSPK
jgi:hypothetical protein